VGRPVPAVFRLGDLDWIAEVSAALEVDVLLALDRSPASEQAGALDGFRWMGREGWGALAPAQDHISHRLLGPEQLLDDLPQHNRVLPEWGSGDPLDALFRVWFGAHGTSPQCISLHGLFAAHATTARISEGAEVPASAASWVTPIAGTSAAIEYKGTSAGGPPSSSSTRQTRAA